MSDLKRKLTENIKCVQGRIAEACSQVNRSPDEVQLVAVTKYAGLDVLKTMPDVGLTDLGESRVQELTKRAAVIHEFLAHQEARVINIRDSRCRLPDRPLRTARVYDGWRGLRDPVHAGRHAGDRGAPRTGGCADALRRG